MGRNAVEYKFGQTKRDHKLGLVMGKLATISKSAMLVAFLVMNLERWLKNLLFWLFYNLRIPNQTITPLQDRQELFVEI